MTTASRTLGSLTVSALGLGCMGMSFAYGPADRGESLRTLNRALDLGVTFLDTADMYGRGANEELLAELLRTRRDEVTLATKFGILVGDDGRATGAVDGSPEYVRRSIDGSLSRLGTDHVELYYLHRPDPDVPVEETVGAMSELVTAGKIGAIGLSEASADTVRRAAAVAPVAALQSEWSVFSRDIEHDVVPACREHGIGLVPYSPLGRGMLTGSFSVDELPAGDFRRTLPRFRGENADTNLALVDELRAIADARDATAGQVALAWLLSRGDDVVPIPGTKRVRYLEENVGALDLVLDDAETARLDALRPAGDRYDDMSWTSRDTLAVR
ncbi:aldo/keto reductase [Pseudonocardia phyllosphaerae]|uniref:aldo/keto reductase n=1 Tax=Pseudonocardia phyllosphaerae TaxID=3390502 RepID=UPI0039785F09